MLYILANAFEPHFVPLSMILMRQLRKLRFRTFDRECGTPAMVCRAFQALALGDGSWFIAASAYSAQFVETRSIDVVIFKMVIQRWSI